MLASQRPVASSSLFGASIWLAVQAEMGIEGPLGSKARSVIVAQFVGIALAVTLEVRPREDEDKAILGLVSWCLRSWKLVDYREGSNWLRCQ